MSRLKWVVDQSGGKLNIGSVHTIAAVDLSPPKAPANTLEQLSRDAERYVLGNGQKTGYEYFFAYDIDNGDVVGRRTDGKTDSVGPGRARMALEDPERRILVTHNHPESTPPSLNDVAQFLLQPGRHTSVVLANDGSRYEMQPTGLLRDTLGAGELEIKSIVARLLARGFQKIEAESVAKHALWLALADVWQLRYNFKLSRGRGIFMDDAGTYLQDAVAYIRRSIQHTLR
ncbi:hypothetical protein CCP4SC76_450001 [Gammaproteobacteria bacterium]